MDNSCAPATMGSRPGNRAFAAQDGSKPGVRLAAHGVRVAPREQWRIGNGLGSLVAGLQPLSQGGHNSLQPRLLRLPDEPARRCASLLASCLHHRRPGTNSGDGVSRSGPAAAVGRNPNLEIIGTAGNLPPRERLLLLTLFDLGQQKLYQNAQSRFHVYGFQNPLPFGCAWQDSARDQVNGLFRLVD